MDEILCIAERNGHETWHYSPRSRRQVSQNKKNNVPDVFRVLCSIDSSHNNLRLGIRHHRDGVTVSHNTRLSTSKLANDAEHSGRNSISLAIWRSRVDNGDWKKARSVKYTRNVGAVFVSFRQTTTK